MSHADRPWVLVCGGFHHVGGMDRLNAALASHLASRGTPVHLVGHDIDAAFSRMPSVAVTRVARPIGSYLAGEAALSRAAHRVRRILASLGRTPVLLGNGGNCWHADVNWVHCVHHAWPPADTGAPAWFRTKNRVFKAWSRRREVRALAGAVRIVANSARTKRDLVTHLHFDPDRIDVVYPGSEPAWGPAAAHAREAARSQWCHDTTRPLVAMIGALGHDVNKGVDLLVDAWRTLEAEGGWTAELVIAGPGDITRWQRRAAGSPSIRFAGLTANAGQLMDSADLLVSPVRYEAYGLAVHEALCRAVPVIVTGSAGIAERLPECWADMLLPDPPAVKPLVARLRAWASSRAEWRARALAISPALRAHSDVEMSARIASIGEGAVR